MGASRRNGGFLEASLTHGLENGLARWPGEVDRLLELGRENFAAIRNTLDRRGIDAAWNDSGVIEVATRPHGVAWLEDAAETARAHGEDARLPDREAVRAEVDSPTCLAGLWHRGSVATVDPARLAWGLRGAALENGVRIFERSAVRRAGTQRGRGGPRDGTGPAARGSRVALDLVHARDTPS